MLGIWFLIVGDRYSDEFAIYRNNDICAYRLDRGCVYLGANSPYVLRREDHLKLGKYTRPCGWGTILCVIVNLCKENT